MSAASLPALTLQRPWGWLIMHGGKDIENRTWSTTYRGELIIHQGKTLDRDHDDDVPPEALQQTGILGTVQLTGTHPASWGCCESPWSMGGQWHWRLHRPKPLPQPIPAIGRLGLWRVDGELLTVVRDGFRRLNAGGAS